jgi:hypothetical protein
MTFVRVCLFPFLLLPGCLLALLLILLLVGGCGGPTQVDRDNGRVLVEVMTALTLKNARLLEASALRARDRHDAGQLADADYQAIESLIVKARDGDWMAAENDANVFRKRRPFVRPGQ